MSRCVVVLGAPHSGGAYVGHALHILGCNMMADEVFSFRSEEVVGNRFNPKPKKTSYQSLIGRRLCLPLWGISDPLLCFTAPFIVPELKDPIFVITHRGSVPIAQEWSRMDEDVSYSEALASVKLYKEAKNKVLKAFPNIPRHYVIHDELIRNPKREILALRDFVIPLDEAVDSVGRE